jgi:alpha-L-fucosidase
MKQTTYVSTLSRPRQIAQGLLMGSIFLMSFQTALPGATPEHDKPLDPTRVINTALPENTAQITQKALEDWRDLRFGMFVHWGPVSQTGTEIGHSRGNQIPVEEYDRLPDTFNPEKFDANEWILTAKEAGMKYFIITSKHHDGFCLWPSDYTDFDITRTKYAGDVIGELAAACERHGLKFGVYYSISDWHHPDYPLDSPRGRTEKPNPNMERYVEYMQNQIRELITRYQPAVLWFDGEWEAPWTEDLGDELYAFIKNIDPSILVNNRVNKGRQGMRGTTREGTFKYPGDFDTPEQRVGLFNRDRFWESCVTLCRQWAWKPDDDMKSLPVAIHMLLNSVGGDGNFLLNVGPMPDGRIEPRQVDRLKEIGEWMERFGHTVYGTRGGPFKTSEQFVSTAIDDRIYILVTNWGENGEVRLPPIEMPILQVSTLTPDPAGVRLTSAGITIVKPQGGADPIATIIELKVDGLATRITPRGLEALAVADDKAGEAQWHEQ